jgi:hypothetical protein
MPGHYPFEYTKPEAWKRYLAKIQPSEHARVKAVREAARIDDEAWRELLAAPIEGARK